jgi:hypothetical protein
MKGKIIGGEKMVRKKKTQGNVQVTGRSIVYIQPLSKSGKPGKAKPALITSVKVGAPQVASKKKRRRRS